MEQIWPNEFVCTACASANNMKRRENKYTAKRKQLSCSQLPLLFLIPTSAHPTLIPATFSLLLFLPSCFYCFFSSPLCFSFSSFSSPSCFSYSFSSLFVSPTPPSHPFVRLLLLLLILFHLILVLLLLLLPLSSSFNSVFSFEIGHLVKPDRVLSVYKNFQIMA